MENMETPYFLQRSSLGLFAFSIADNPSSRYKLIFSLSMMFDNFRAGKYQQTHRPQTHHHAIPLLHQIRYFHLFHPNVSLGKEKVFSSLFNKFNNILGNYCYCLSIGQIQRYLITLQWWKDKTQQSQIF